jgi:hypothetical protein
LRLGCSLHSARQIQNVASVLNELPLCIAAFAESRLSWDKLVLVCAFATPETDALYAETAPTMTIKQLQELGRRAKEISDEDAADAHEARSMRFTPTRDGRMMRINGLLPIEDGVIAQKAHERVGNSIGPDHNGDYLPIHQLNADAFNEICSTYLRQDSDAVRSTVVIEADYSVLDGFGNGDIEGQGPISPETIRRYMCTSNIELTIVKDGKTIGTGRETRLFSREVRRALRKRDQGCRFPGCQRERWIDSHHIDEWVRDFGPSDEDNGVCLCQLHHKFVHEMHWSIEGNPYGALIFIAPSGRKYAGMPPPLIPEVRNKFTSMMNRELKDVQSPTTRAG